MATPVHIILVTRSSFINEWRNKYYHSVMGNNKLHLIEKLHPWRVQELHNKICIVYPFLWNNALKTTLQYNLGCSIHVITCNIRFKLTSRYSKKTVDCINDRQINKVNL